MNTTPRLKPFFARTTPAPGLRLALAATVIAATPLPAAEDVVFAEFEGDHYIGWAARGTAFGTGPAEGPLPGQMAVEGFGGKRLLNSFHGGDDSTGTLTSDEFTLSKPYISFLLGGGGFPGKTCLNLVIDGRVVRTATGPNTQPGGSERLSQQGWEVAEFTGKQARLVVVDDATGGWGHLNLDHIVFTDAKPPLWLRNATREITAERRWLHFPIRTGAPKRKITLTLDGATEPPLDIELADTAPEWWAPLDVSSVRGKKLVVAVDTLREDSEALTSISQDDVIRGADPLYREPLRPQFHFSPRRGWNNDPNGLVFRDGTWHLFFQHNPYGWNWGNMHWSHATSPDLVHWTEEGVALRPDPTGPMFSGSGVVDWKNTSGLGREGKPPLCFFYTAAGDPTVQCLASSTDGGKTLVKFPGNPVLRQITPGNRDPKVLWHEPTQRWVMVLYVGKDKKHFVQFFTSTDLKSWTYRSEIDGLYECPDFFELPTDGDDSKRLWVLTAANSEYLLGTFDGGTFSPVSAKLPGHRGKGFYAAQTYSDAPKGRRIQIGWLQAPSPGMPFNQCMSLPLELGLRTTPDGPRLTMLPAEETSALTNPGTSVLGGAFTPLTLSSSVPLPDTKVPELVRLDTRFSPRTAEKVSFTLRGATIIYDCTKQEFIVNGHRAHAPLIDGRQQFTAFLDRTTLEVFASGGLTYIPKPFIAKPDDLSLRATATGGEAVLDSLQVREVRSIWPR